MSNRNLEKLTKEIKRFREERNWQQFHNLKDMIISLHLESSELLELVQWKTSEELLEKIKKDPTEISDELSDILYWLLIIASDLNIDLGKAFEDKMLKNQKKYPVEKSLNCKKKYTDI